MCEARIPYSRNYDFVCENKNIFYQFFYEQIVYNFHFR